ncbi:MAG: MAE_28990/MAE_18760 family HEPN-like nuclease [Aridibacter sp.]
MKKVKSDFDKRKAEINKYFEFLEKLHKDMPKISYSELGKTKTSKVDLKLRKILRANGFLLIYNLVESSCRNSIWEILTAVKSEKLSFTKLSQEVQDLWIKQKIKNLREANDSTLKRNFQELAEEIINNSIIEFKVALQKLEVGETNVFDISGNIDAKRIREIASICGFNGKVGKARERAGVCLETIKNNRNLLAHGRKTFTECGQIPTVQDMISYKNDAISYLEGVLDNIENYLKDKKFKK